MAAFGQWFWDTFDRNCARSQVELALREQIDDIVQDLSAHLVGDVKGRLIDAPTPLEEVKILLRYLDAHCENTELIDAFQKSVSQLDTVGYMLSQTLVERLGLSVDDRPVPAQETVAQARRRQFARDNLPRVNGHDILQRAAVLQALHDAADEDFAQPRCHPETRKKILDDLFRWATTNHSVPAFNWLYGPAGAGKSSIMRSTCMRLQEKGRLGGSFFFKRGDSTRGNAKALFVTLAYQLASTNVDLRPSIFDQVEKDPTIVAREMSVQLQSLVIAPCLARKPSSPVVFLIDGLDECQTPEMQREILRLIRSVAAKSSRTFRFLVASRPEAHITETFGEDTFTNAILHRTNVEQSFKDVRIYLEKEFLRILHEHSSMRGAPPTWPSKNDLNKLVSRSSGYFIYAATVVKFVEDEDLFPDEQLQLILSLTWTDENPFSMLDQLYRQILSTVKHQNKMMQILCLIFDLDFSYSRQIEEILKLRTGEVGLVLRQLRSLIKITPSLEDGMRFSMHHASLIDFFRDSRRSQNFHIDSRYQTTVVLAILSGLSSGCTTFNPWGEDASWSTGRDTMTWAMVERRWFKLLEGIEPSITVDSKLLSAMGRFQPPWFQPLQQPLGLSSQLSQRQEPLPLPKWQWKLIFQIKAWLQKVHPIPQDLIQRWEKFRFMSFYQSVHEDFPLSIDNIVETTVPLNNIPCTSHSLAQNEIADILYSLSPLTLRILHAGSLGNGQWSSYNRNFTGNSSSYTYTRNTELFYISILLDISIEEMMTAISSLQAIFDSTPGIIVQIWRDLSQIRPDEHSKVARDMALQCMQWRELKADNLGSQPSGVKEHLQAECFHQAPWGTWMALSPPSDPDILHTLHGWEPPADAYSHNPIQVYDLVQWLKALPSSDQELIGRWDNYLSSVNQVHLKLQLERREKRKVQLTSPQFGCLLHWIRKRWTRFTGTEDDLDSLDRKPQAFRRYSSDYSESDEDEDEDEEGDESETDGLVVRWKRPRTATTARFKRERHETDAKLTNWEFWEDPLG
ncbi:hypothetical protein C8F01DRAFT_1321617 [Mycena amicta]|nr:hypothetical protein C8F01DRAFT_1321617 [Mycena amicta]